MNLPLTGDTRGAKMQLPSYLPDPLSELAPWSVISWLPRLHRAGPSASLDRSAV
jgi:hypothetical protein